MLKIRSIILFVLICRFAVSQSVFQPSFYNLDPETFNAKNISTIKNDHHDGFWLLSDKGLGHYNGYSTQYFQYNKDDKNSPLSKNMHNLYIDKKGIVWVGYADVSAISSFDPQSETFTHFISDTTNKKSFPKDAVLSEFYEDSQNRFWVTTWGGGLLLLNKEKGNFEKYTHNDKNKSLNQLMSNTVRAMLELEKDKFLITYFEENPNTTPSIFDAAKKTFTPFPIDDYLKNVSKEMGESIKHCLTICHFVYKDKNSGFWFGTYSGLVYVDVKNKTSQRISGKPFNDHFISLENTRDYIIDENNNLWTNTVNSGIMIVNMETKKAFYHKQLYNCEACVGSNLITTFTKDNENNIWVSNGNGGVSIYNPLRQKFTIKPWAELKVDFTDPSNQNVPFSKMLLRGTNKLYISSANGISIYDYKTDSLLPSIETKGGKINKGREKHIFHFKIYDNTLFYQTVNNELTSFIIGLNLKTKKETSYGIEKHAHELFFNNDSVTKPYALIGYNTVLKAYNKQTDAFDSVYKFKGSFQVYYSTVLKNDKWFFSNGVRGFFTMDSKTKNIISYSSTKGADKIFPDSTINAYYYNKKSTVWIATSNGVYSFDENTQQVKSCNEELGIKNIPVYQIAESLNGDLWFTSNKELYQFNFKNKKLSKFNKALGLSGDGFNHKRNIPEIVVSPEGLIFFATIKGVLIINPKKMNVPQTIPEINIYKININDSALSKNELTLFLNSSGNLKWNQNFITFELNTSQPFTPTPNKFQYRLLGLEDKWVDNGISNKIRFTNLDNGTYTLQVKCVNAYEIESAVLSQTFIINKPFWKTGWFILLCIISVVGLVVFIIKQREKASEQKKLQLEETIKERTYEVVLKAEEIKHQKDIIEEKQKELTDSIKYAQRIQNALLASKSLLDMYLKNYFIYYNPKDIVSGDFYWATAINNKFYLIVADSTGHGVPGAFMSLLNISFLNEAINEKQMQHPNEILNHVRLRLIQNLSEDGSAEGGKDGMDCSLLCFDFATKKLEFACANNPVLIVRNGIALEQNSDRMPVGKSPKEDVSFTNYTFDLEKNDTVYILTDGYSDQFGGEKGKKLKYKHLKEFLVDNNHLSLREQQQFLSDKFTAWKGNLEQVDDVCIVGIKI